MTKARKRILIAIMLSLVTFLATFAALRPYSGAQVPVTVSVQPPDSTWQVDSFFDVFLQLESFPSEPLDAFEIAVNFDTSLMEVVGVIPGPVVPGGDMALFNWLYTGSGIMIRDMPPNGFPLNQAPRMPIAYIQFHCLHVGDSMVRIDPLRSRFFDIFGGWHPVSPIDGIVDQAYPPAHTYIQPPTVTVPISTPFTVDVNVQSVTNLYGYSLVLNYNTLYVDAIDIVPGSFLPQPIIDNKIIDDATGTISFTVHSGTGTGTTGSGTLARITFHCTGAGESILTITTASYWDPAGYPIPTTTAGGRAIQFAYWEPIKLQNIVEWPGRIAYVPMPGYIPPPTPGYRDLQTMFEAKGFTFIPTEIVAMELRGSIQMVGEPLLNEFSGVMTSHWSSNVSPNGTRAALLSVAMNDGTYMTMGFETNLLDPTKVPGIDPYIIVNAQPYLFTTFYWYEWPTDVYPLGRIVPWSYWWYDSHSHPNWFWGVYYWWRTYTRAIFYGLVWPPFDVNWVVWRPWWGWWWNWVYWRHWYWWSTYFPYDPL